MHRIAFYETDAGDGEAFEGIPMHSGSWFIQALSVKHLSHAKLACHHHDHGTTRQSVTFRGICGYIVISQLICMKACCIITSKVVAMCSTPNHQFLAPTKSRSVERKMHASLTKIF